MYTMQQTERIAPGITTGKEVNPLDEEDVRQSSNSIDSSRNEELIQRIRGYCESEEEEMKEKIAATMMGRQSSQVLQSNLQAFDQNLMQKKEDAVLRRRRDEEEVGKSIPQYVPQGPAVIEKGKSSSSSSNEKDAKSGGDVMQPQPGAHAVTPMLRTITSGSSHTTSLRRADTGGMQKAMATARKNHRNSVASLPNTPIQQDLIRSFGNGYSTSEESEGEEDDDDEQEDVGQPENQPQHSLPQEEDDDERSQHSGGYLRLPELERQSAILIRPRPGAVSVVPSDFMEDNSSNNHNENNQEGTGAQESGDLQDSMESSRRSHQSRRDDGTEVAAAAAAAAAAAGGSNGNNSSSDGMENSSSRRTNNLPEATAIRASLVREEEEAQEQFEQLQQEMNQREQEMLAMQERLARMERMEQELQQLRSAVQGTMAVAEPVEVLSSSPSLASTTQPTTQQQQQQQQQQQRQQQSSPVVEALPEHATRISAPRKLARKSSSDTDPSCMKKRSNTSSYKQDESSGGRNSSTRSRDSKRDSRNSAEAKRAKAAMDPQDRKKMKEKGMDVVDYAAYQYLMGGDSLGGGGGRSSSGKAKRSNSNNKKREALSSSVSSYEKRKQMLVGSLSKREGSSNTFSSTFSLSSKQSTKGGSADLSLPMNDETARLAEDEEEEEEKVEDARSPRHDENHQPPQGNQQQGGGTASAGEDASDAAKMIESTKSKTNQRADNNNHASPPLRRDHQRSQNTSDSLVVPTDAAKCGCVIL